MYAQLRETATELAGILWREHTVYRERGGGVVIRGDHVGRWISLAPTGGRDQALLRAGRLLDGGTTAPARAEVVVDLTAGAAELATVCRRLLAEVAADAGPAAPAPATARGAGRAGKAPKPGRVDRPREGRHTGPGSWLVLALVGLAVGAWVCTTFIGFGA